MTPDFSKRRLPRLGRFAVVLSATIIPLTQVACSNMQAGEVAQVIAMARELGADVKIKGELGPARFGPSFQADLGLRLDVEAETNTGSVTQRDLLRLNMRLLQLLENE